jgi:hypothetical protein
VNTLEPVADARFAPNTLVTVAPIGRNYARPISTLEYFGPIMGRWAARLGGTSETGRQGARVMAYEYYAGVYANNSLPMPAVTILADDIKYYAGTGFGGITIQAEEGHWGTYGLNFYALARMAYRGRQDPRRLIADFCANYYGPAAEPMTRYWTLQETLIRRQAVVGPAGEFFRLLCRTPGAIDSLDAAVVEAERLATSDEHRARVRLSRLSVEYMKRLRAAAEAGRGAVLDALKPTPKGKGHVGPRGSGASVHLRFPVPTNGGLELCLGNVVAMKGGGTSYRIEIRRDAPHGVVVHAGKTFRCSIAQAETHRTARAWNHDNRMPIAVTSSLTDADRVRGHIDLFVTAHVDGDTWTIYRDDNGSSTRDIYAQVPPPNAKKARRHAWERLEQFIRTNARAGILNAAPSYVLAECKRMINAQR